MLGSFQSMPLDEALSAMGEHEFILLSERFRAATPDPLSRLIERSPTPTKLSPAMVTGRQKRRLFATLELDDEEDEDVESFAAKSRRLDPFEVRAQPPRPPPGKKTPPQDSPACLPTRAQQGVLTPCGPTPATETAMEEENVAVAGENCIEGESRLAKTQRLALACGRSVEISWKYDLSDELVGAFCDGQWFGKDELYAASSVLSSISTSPPRTMA